MWDHLSFVIKHLRELLWIRPLIVCVLSVGVVFLANLIDLNGLGRFLPVKGVESLLGSCLIPFMLPTP